MGEQFHSNKFNSLHIYRIFLWEKQKMENTCTLSTESTEYLRVIHTLPSLHPLTVPTALSRFQPTCRIDGKDPQRGNHPRS